MAVEAKRRCGYRKVGGLYLCSDALGAPCCKLPIILDICPTCNGGIKQSRGWQWIDPRPWLSGDCSQYSASCPAASPQMLGERVGLLWIGEQFYPTPSSFAIEATTLGVSRRIPAIPHGFKLGETWVFLAHPKMREIRDPATNETVWHGGIFRIFRPTRLEKIVTETQSQDQDAMKKLAERGINPVVVPDNDRDHQGTVYDDDVKDQQQLEIAVL